MKVIWLKITGAEAMSHEDVQIPASLNQSTHRSAFVFSSAGAAQRWSLVTHHAPVVNRNPVGSPNWHASEQATDILDNASFVRGNTDRVNSRFCSSRRCEATTIFPFCFLNSRAPACPRHSFHSSLPHSSHLCSFFWFSQFRQLFMAIISGRPPPHSAAITVSVSSNSSRSSLTFAKCPLIHHFDCANAEWLKVLTSRTFADSACES